MAPNIKYMHELSLATDLLTRKKTLFNETQTSKKCKKVISIRSKVHSL